MLDQDEINALLKQTDEIDNSTQETKDDTSQDSFDDIDMLVAAASSEYDTIEEDAVDEVGSDSGGSSSLDDLGSQTWAEQKISDATLPYPVEPNHKVVDQLSQVTADGEIKAGEVFDSILSATEQLGNIDNKLTNLNKQCMAISKFIAALQAKFPNVDIFAKKSQDIQMMLIDVESMQTNSADATNDLFKAMETMQYQDISRQKIERVISVVKKLSQYLNNVFETDHSAPDIKVAKHIHGDQTNSGTLVDEDDIEDLIKEFGTERAYESNI